MLSFEAITKAFVDFHWLSDRDATWDDVVRLACYCLPVDAEDEEENKGKDAAMKTLLVDESHAHEKAKHCDDLDLVADHGLVFTRHANPLRAIGMLKRKSYLKKEIRFSIKHTEGSIHV